MPLDFRDDSNQFESTSLTNPALCAGVAVLSDDPDGQAGNSLTSNPAPAKSGHHTLALVDGIAGTVVAGFGTVMLVGGSGWPHQLPCPAYR